MYSLSVTLRPGQEAFLDAPKNPLSSLTLFPWLGAVAGEAAQGGASFLFGPVVCPPCPPAPAVTPARLPSFHPGSSGMGVGGGWRAGGPLQSAEPLFTSQRGPPQRIKELPQVSPS